MSRDAGADTGALEPAAIVDATGVPIKDWAVLAYLCGDNPGVATHVEAQKDALLAWAGSPRVHVAAQWDLPSGAARAVAQDDDAWHTEALGRVDTGEAAPCLEFLRWALDRCPARHVLLAFSGTGLLDPRAVAGGPDDREHLFSVCNDATTGGSLSLKELGDVLQRAAPLTPRGRFDILLLDMREVQCLEVAYELEGEVDYLIAPQTRIPETGLDFSTLLAGCAAGPTPDDQSDVQQVEAVARGAVRAVGQAYSRAADGSTSVSALDLASLKHVAPAFDTLSFAIVQSLGDPLIWNARAAVARRLKSPTQPAEGPATSANAATDRRVEAEYLYDLVEMLGELRKEFDCVTHCGLVQVLLDHFRRLDAAGFRRALQSIEDACFASGARLRDPALATAIVDPVATRQGLIEILDLARVRAATWTTDAAPVHDALKTLFTAAPDRHERVTWLDGWPPAVIDALDEDLAAAYRDALRQQKRLCELERLTRRVLRLLTGDDPAPAADGAAPIAPLILEHVDFDPPGQTPRHGGVSLFRPRVLDQLIASDYLDLRFNRKIHWTVLLAVINLIDSHPLSLWRILSTVLATADYNTRAQLIDRITGQGSVIAPFRKQFTVWERSAAYTLSLEPDPSVIPATIPARHRADEAAAGGEAFQAAAAYRVRLESAERDAFISEVVSVVDRDALEGVERELVALLEDDDKASLSEVDRIESLGRTLGEDLLQDLGISLADHATTDRDPHLQLQIPRDLMRYPWELMHDKSGWLCEHFALGRQVFSRTAGTGLRGRKPGALRALVIGDAGALPGAGPELSAVAASLQTLAAETDGLIDFNPDEDYRPNGLTRHDLRSLLRDGNYDIVHFAGHAAFDRNHPEASAWMLADGPLSAQAIRNTLRWRETQPWLVFSNACESAMDGGGAAGLYQGEVFGLASAFLDNGASVFIGPLWRIDDTIAEETAKIFYGQLLKERKTVGEALRAAKAAVKRRYYDPAHDAPKAGRLPSRASISWAGLVLYGNSTATMAQRLAAPAPPVSAQRDTADD